MRYERNFAFPDTADTMSQKKLFLRNKLRNMSILKNSRFLQNSTRQISAKILMLQICIKGKLA